MRRHAVDPLVVHRWPGYDVAFPGHRRRLDSSYACVTSARFARCVAEALAIPGSQLLTGTTALEVHADRVVLRTADSVVSELRGTAVIDARGPDHGSPTACGWQKFLGQEFRLTAPHGLDRPMLMDATVQQRDGFRFVYVLPLGPDRVLVEDTYFSDGTLLDVAALRGEIASYIAARGWRIAELEREEVGVLPLPWQHEPPAVMALLIAGYAGG